MSLCDRNKMIIKCPGFVYNMPAEANKFTLPGFKKGAAKRNDQHGTLDVMIWHVILMANLNLIA